MVISSNDYISIISEHFDLSDYETRKNVICCDEDAKETVILHLTNKLYNNIKDNVDNIDFGTIPLSKGDITKIEGYENLVGCINTISSLIKEYNQPTTIVDTVSTAIDNLQKRKRLWEKSFAMNIEIPVIIYNTMTLSCVSSISLLINTCIEYIKNRDGSITTAFDKAAYAKSKNHVLFKSLVDFNAGCANGQMDKFVDNNIKANLTRIKESYEENDGEYSIMQEFNFDMNTVKDVATTAAGFLDEKNKNRLLITASVLGAIYIGLNIKWILQHILYMIRRTVYYFMFMKQSVSDYFTSQADFLQINAENLKYRDQFQDEDERKKVYDTQMKWVERFRKAANIFMIKDKKAQNDADKKEKDDSKPTTYDDTAILF